MTDQGSELLDSLAELAGVLAPVVHILHVRRVQRPRAEPARAEAKGYEQPGSVRYFDGSTW